MSEACYTHLSRRELRQMTLSRLGFDSAGDSSDMVSDMVNRYLWAASLWASEKVEWKNTKRTVEFTLGQEQGSIGYPIGCGPGSILQMSVWLDGQTQSACSRYALYPGDAFVPLRNITFANDWDQDPKWDAGGVEMQETTGFPVAWACRDTILIRPLPDKARPAKILYTYLPELRCDDDRTVMDGELLIRYAMAEYYAYAEEQTNADRQMARAEQRVRHLRGQQGTNQIMEYMAGLNLSLSPDEEVLGGRTLSEAARYDFTPPPFQYDPHA